MELNSHILSILEKGIHCQFYRNFGVFFFSFKSVFSSSKEWLQIFLTAFVSRYLHHPYLFLLFFITYYVIFPEEKYFLSRPLGFWVFQGSITILYISCMWIFLSIAWVYFLVVHSSFLMFYSAVVFLCE